MLKLLIEPQAINHGHISKMEKAAGHGRIPANPARGWNNAMCVDILGAFCDGQTRGRR